MNSNAFSAADMTTAAANGHRDGYQAGYADAVKAVEVGKPAAAQEAVEDASNIIELLLTLAYAAWSLADNADGGSGNDNVSVDRRDFDKVSEALDALDELPDDQPGYVMEAAAKARWALRGILASPVAAAPVDPNGLILDLRAAVSIGRPLLHSDVDEIERALASAPAAPGIDLSEVPRYTLAHGDFESQMLEHSRGAWVRLSDVESALIDASPKGGSDEPNIPEPSQECYSDDGGDSWHDHPADADLVDGLAVGDTYPLTVSHYSVERTYRVTKAPDETSDDYEVEPVQATSAEVGA